LASIEVYGSNNYFTTTQYSRDKCLCGQYRTGGIDPPPPNAILLDDCRIALQDKCLTAIIGKNSELDKLFEKFVQDCALDLNVRDKFLKIDIHFSKTIYLT
jgi:hypothetical protein